MIFCMAYHAGDKEQVQRWLSWVEELGGLGVHRLFLMPCKGQAADFKTGLPFEVVQDAQGIVSDWSDPGESTVRDASGANSMVRQAAWHFYLGKLGPWMFIEPDCIPLRTGWADEIEADYQRGGKPFMAAFVPGIPGSFPDHATGNMVLPGNTPEVSRLLMLPTNVTIEGDPTQRAVELAFDVAAAPEILPKCHFTNLIQHVFRGEKFTRADHLARINPAACLWHTDKDGGLIQLLREKKNANTATKTQQDAASATVQVTATGEGAKNEVQAKIRPRVHTFFRPCVDPEAFEEQKRILSIWEKNWRDHGWEPVILTEVHARKHPDYEKLKAAFEKLPTVSPKEYEMACWMRWVAMSLCGGLMVDYDVLINGFDWFRPQESGDYPIILSDKNPVPCAVIGGERHFQLAVNAFLAIKVTTTERGQPHLSDQLAVQVLKFGALDVCREFGKPGWEKAKLIHFSHAACGKILRSNAMSAFVRSRPTPEVLESIHEEVKRSVADCIVELVEFSKKDGFAKGRIVKQLRAAGLIPKK